MVEMKTVYTGGLHCELEHGPSKTKIQTDAPKDNKGRGESFSPTDLLGVSLASCILTTMAIKFENENMSLKGARATVQKEMVADPARRVGRLVLKIELPKHVPSDLRSQLEAVAQTCPVHHSLHPDLKKDISFQYNL